MRFLYPSKIFNSNAETKQLHKNLFIDNLEPRSFSLNNSDYSFADEYTLENDCSNEYNEFDKNSYRLSHLPLFLTGKLWNLNCRKYFIELKFNLYFQRFNSRKCL